MIAPAPRPERLGHSGAAFHSSPFARFMSAPARLTGTPQTRLLRDSLAETAPTLRDCHALCFSARPAPVRGPSPSFPFLGAWFLSVRAETTNASKEGKEST
jgi:hypothetical protein